MVRRGTGALRGLVPETIHLAGICLRRRHFDDTSNIVVEAYVKQLNALGQEGRLEIFRLLVRAGPLGSCVVRVQVRPLRKKAYIPSFLRVCRFRSLDPENGGATQGLQTRKQSRSRGDRKGERSSALHVRRSSVRLAVAVAMTQAAGFHPFAPAPGAGGGSPPGSRVW
jgi:hypothetical protein